MAAHCPLDFDITRLRDAVRAMYTRVAETPDGEFHFHRGPEFAVDTLGYDPSELARVPSVALSRFAGVGNPLAIGPIHAAERVLDHACGAGTDLLLAAHKVGPSGRVIGVDMTAPMRAVAWQAAQQAGVADRVEIRAGLFEELPVDDSSIDVVISNGVVNLSPDKRQVFREIRRVLVPGGRLYLADVVLQRELKLEARRDPDLWAACIGGALPEAELFELALEAGFAGGRIVERFDSFRHTTAENKVAKDLSLASVNFFACKSA